MSKRTKMMMIAVAVLLLAAVLYRCGSERDDSDDFRIIFAADAQWIYESREDVLDPLSLLSDQKSGITCIPEQIDLRILGDTEVIFTHSSSGQKRQMTVTVVEPLITVIRPQVFLAVGEQYELSENIISRFPCLLTPESIDASAPGSFSITVTAEGDGIRSEKSFEVIVSEENMIWVVDVPFQPAQTVDVWIVDRPAEAEQGHWEIIEPAVEEQGHYEDVVVEEQGHWQQVIVSPEIPEQGHWETVHHDEVSHQQPVYENYKYWIFEFSDGQVFKVYQYELEEMGLTATQYAARYEDAHPGVTGRWHSEIEKRLVGYQTVIDQPAYDEEVWIIDVPYQPAVTESRWIVDQPQHIERRWVVDVAARPEKRKWIVDRPGRPEEGHWEQRIIPEVPEQGHWEPAVEN